MKKAVFLDVDGSVRVVDMPDDIPLTYWYDGIGCDMIEIVHPKGLRDGYVLVVDEEGLLKPGANINTVASGLYGFLEHGEPIVGNAFLVAETYGPDGPELDGMDEDVAEAVAEFCREKMREWFLPVLYKLVEGVGK